ncbi:MAG: hypothetical protein AMXMBFR33_20020 [Candidatus Xenobia bacterium]
MFSRAAQRALTPVFQALLTPDQGRSDIPNPFDAQDLRELVAPEGQGKYQTYREFAGLEQGAPYASGGTLPPPATAHERLQREALVTLAEMLTPDVDAITEVATAGAPSLLKRLGRTASRMSRGRALSRLQPSVPRGQVQEMVDAAATGAPVQVASPQVQARLERQADLAADTETPARPLAQLAETERQLAQPRPRPAGPKSAYELRRELRRSRTADDPNVAFDEFTESLQTRAPDDPNDAFDRYAEGLSRAASGSARSEESPFFPSPEFEGMGPQGSSALELSHATRPDGEMVRPELSLEDLELRLNRPRAEPEAPALPAPRPPRRRQARKPLIQEILEEVDQVDTSRVSPAEEARARVEVVSDLSDTEAATTAPTVSPEQTRAWARTLSRWDQLQQPHLVAARQSGQDVNAVREWFRSVEPPEVSEARTRLEQHLAAQNAPTPTRVDQVDPPIPRAAPTGPNVDQVVPPLPAARAADPVAPTRVDQVDPPMPRAAPTRPTLDQAARTAPSAADQWQSLRAPDYVRPEGGGRRIKLTQRDKVWWPTWTPEQRRNVLGSRGRARVGMDFEPDAAGVRLAPDEPPTGGTTPRGSRAAAAQQRLDEAGEYLAQKRAAAAEAASSGRFREQAARELAQAEEDLEVAKNQFNSSIASYSRTRRARPGRPPICDARWLRVGGARSIFSPRQTETR